MCLRCLWHGNKKKKMEHPGGGVPAFREGGFLSEKNQLRGTPASPWMPETLVFRTWSSNLLHSSFSTLKEPQSYSYKNVFSQYLRTAASTRHQSGHFGVSLRTIFNITAHLCHRNCRTTQAINTSKSVCALCSGTTGPSATVHLSVLYLRIR